MDAPTATLQLDDGRQLAWAEFGDPGGSPLFYCHGFPGCRLEAGLLHTAALELGVRALAADRPGYGRSDPQPKRGLLHWPADVRSLAEHLGIGRFHVVGVSGGGPFALACGAALGDRVRAIALVCPLGPLVDGSLLHSMHWPAWMAFGMAQHLPWLPDLLYRGLAAPMLHWQPQWLLSMLGTVAPRADADVLSRPGVRSTLAGSMREAVSRGPDGALRDQHIYLQPWGLQLADLTPPVQIWHGSDDTTVPAAHGRYLAQHVAGSRFHLLQGEGHYSLPVDHARDILRQLLQSGTASTGHGFDANP